MGSDKEDLRRWADLVLDGKPINIDQTIRQQAARIAALESTERELRDALKVLAEYGGAFHGLGGPFKCWDSRRAINAFDAMLNNPIAAAAVREAGR